MLAQVMPDLPVYLGSSSPAPIVAYMPGVTAAPSVAAATAKPYGAPKGWGDFREYPASAGKKWDSMCCWTVSFTSGSYGNAKWSKPYQYGKTWHVSLNLQLSKVKASVDFDPVNSYVVHGTQTDALLKHELLHYTLAQYVTQRMQAYIDSVLPLKGFGCGSGASVKEAKQKAWDQAKSQIDAQYYSLFNLFMNDVNAVSGETGKYDSQTNHSQDPKAQANWEAHYKTLTDQATRDINVVPHVLAGAAVIAGGKAASSTLSTLASFDASDGTYPANLVMDASGNLFGTTSRGGTSGKGTIFEIAAGSSIVTTLASFDGSNGANPCASLILDSSGSLFGTTAQGGASGQGTVFELAKGSGTITTLASFNGSNGADPEAPLVMDSSGNLFGTTVSGGTNGQGTVFELAAGSGTVTTLASFEGASGAYPYAGLAVDTTGNLFGTTSYGGDNDEGTVFKLAAGSGTITTLASFNGTDGACPYAGVFLDTAGNLFGTTTYGGTSDQGTVFKIAAGSGAVTTLASFDGTRGANPQTALLMDTAGNLFGTTSCGGDNDEGTVFELAAGSGTITTLASFDGSNGAHPQGTLVADGSGNLFGTTAAGDGTVFKLPTGTSTLVTLAALSDQSGANSYAGMITDAAGNLFGTTAKGGTAGVGTIFEVVKSTGTVTTLASFTGANGASPHASLVMDAAGNLFGTTAKGGADNQGTVFELAKGSSSITTLVSFDGTNGADPEAALILDASGNLFGTTATGGASNQGTVFELAKGSSTITTLASFDGTHGANPEAALLRDSAGNLFGTTAYGGTSGKGTVFELALGSSAITTLASFNGTNGATPCASLIADAAGNLFGTTTYGGTSDKGTLFKLVKGSGTITTLTSFNGAKGADPWAGLVMDAAGNLFGTTTAGGANGMGTVFELRAGKKAITTLASFSGINGAYPVGDLVLNANGNLFGTTAQGGGNDTGIVFKLRTVQEKTAPKAALTAENVITDGGTSYRFTVTYTDNTEMNPATLGNSNVLVKGKGFSQLATLQGSTLSLDDKTLVAVYSITPPGGVWSASNNGVYTATMQAKQVTDASGNAVARRTLGTFTVDTLPPTAKLTAADVTKAGDKPYTFKVTYADNIAVKLASIGQYNLRVTGPNGYDQPVSLVKVSPNKDAATCVVTYTLAAPTGGWTAAANGTYTIVAQADQVTDTSLHALAAGPLGTFTINIPASKASSPLAGLSTLTPAAGLTLSSKAIDHVFGQLEDVTVSAA